MAYMRLLRWDVTNEVLPSRRASNPNIAGSAFLCVSGAWNPCLRLHEQGTCN